MAFTGLRTIGQIHLSVSNVERSIMFYRDTLGIPFLFRVPGKPMAFFDCDGVRLYLGKPETGDLRSSGVVYFRVDDIEEAHGRLLDRGVNFMDEPHLIARMPDQELWMSAFRDPDDNRLVLMSERPLSL